jgi:hypothetical protein
MGFTPQQVDAMSFWQFMSSWDGYCQFHGHKSKAEAMSDEEFDDMLERLG